MQDYVQRVFQRAVLKVDVSAPKAVFDENRNNICKSEGTAFVIGEQLAVTATHVYALDPACGPPVIALESKFFNVEVFADVVAVYDDVTVLKFSGSLPEPICALGPSNSDVTEVEGGVRFGIPGGMDDPTPMPVRIGSNQGQFKPFVQLTPTPAERGESGGPVVYMFNVVGILRAKHAKYPAYSVMTPIGQLRTLLAEQTIPLNARLCNPVELSFWSPDATATPEESEGAIIRVPSALVLNMDDVKREAEERALEVRSGPSPDDSTFRTIEITLDLSKNGWGTRVDTFAAEIAEFAKTTAWHQYIADLRADSAPKDAAPPSSCHTSVKPGRQPDYVAPGAC
ncbi:hypothetical protein GOB19_27490 [Sinorhizobium meliloti]|nr:hypothetical protein [Sinorhizobium meliloti]MDX0016729.1 hypothetical protein [Sinorhizobium meliloti]MDX0163267.1 hypothetical protein [Sinorhizobium meliloti]